MIHVKEIIRGCFDVKVAENLNVNIIPKSHGVKKRSVKVKDITFKRKYIHQYLISGANFLR